jgi:hypothetical protein
MKALTERNAALAQERDAAQAKADEAAKQPAAPAKKPGVDPLPNGKASAKSADGEDPVAQFEDLVAAEMSRAKSARHVAHTKVARREP